MDTVSGTSSAIKTIPNCKYRLPCGICELTKQLCSEQGTVINLQPNPTLYPQTFWETSTSSKDIDNTLYSLQNSTTAEFLGLEKEEN